jgi:hypothetical protein
MPAHLLPVPGQATRWDGFDTIPNRTLPELAFLVGIRNEIPYPLNRIFSTLIQLLQAIGFHEEGQDILIH